MLWLIMGIGISIQAVVEKNYLMLLPSFYFVFAAIANIGCCASGSCTTGFNNKNNIGTVDEVEFEEVQSKK